jgi:hypothetical protein
MIETSLITFQNNIFQCGYVGRLGITSSPFSITFIALHWNFYVMNTKPWMDKSPLSHMLKDKAVPPDRHTWPKEIKYQ